MGLPNRTRWAFVPSVWQDGAGLIDAALQNGGEIAVGVKYFSGDPASGARFQVQKEAASNPALTVTRAAPPQSFVSLAIDIPPEHLAALSFDYLFRVEGLFTADDPLHGYVRLNLQAGQEPQRVNKSFAVTGSGLLAEFDLKFWPQDPAACHKGWVDIILDQPVPNSFSLSNVRLLGRMRAFV